MPQTLTISIGESRRSTHWVPKTVTWEQLCKKLQTPKVTNETVAEYAAMTKEQRSKIKDVGGYVGGRIEGGNRKAGSITDRQLVCLDADYADLGLWDTWDLMIGKACLMHTSHSHTPETPRLRFVIPLSRPVTAAEYEPIARRIAEWLDINAFDDTTYEASRLMFWGSCSKDAEYICKVYPSEDWINPDEVLATYADWHDMSTWPVSSRQTTAIHRSEKAQGDPLTKPGVIGAFNRAYTITAAIEAYLPDVYVPTSEEGRWTYAAGHSVGGAVIYDNDSFIYSYHDTDPISKRLCNAYDMVRLHLYGSQDEGITELSGELPSVQAMNNMLQNDEKVRNELATALVANAGDAFESKVDLQLFEGDLDEQGLTTEMADEFGGVVRYSKALGWMFWDGIRWCESADAEISLMIMRFNNNLYAKTRLQLSIATDPKVKQHWNKVKQTVSRLRTAPGLAHETALLKHMVNINDTRIYDANPWDLNTPEGIVDLRTGEMRAHDHRANCTKCTEYAPGGTGAQQWLAFIESITGGDKDFAEYLQTLAGMAAVGAVYEEGLVISYGQGSNGKSTFFGVLKEVMGSYARTINADVLVATGGNTDQSYVASLRGARLVVLSETEENAVMSAAQLKRITSQDVISARSLYKDPIEFTPTHTVVLHTNYLPKINGMIGNGLKRRIAVAPFLNSFTGDNRIKGLKDQLVNQCGPAIMKWIVNGAIRFYSAGYTLEKPKCVLDATREYIEGEDLIGTFLSECCDTDPEAKVKSSDLFIRYQVWCGTQGLRPKCTRDFAKALEAAGIEKQRTKTCVMWKGLKLHEED